MPSMKERVLRRFATENDAIGGPSSPPSQQTKKPKTIQDNQVTPETALHARYHPTFAPKAPNRPSKQSHHATAISLLEKSGDIERVTEYPQSWKAVPLTSPLPPDLNQFSDSTITTTQMVIGGELRGDDPFTKYIKARVKREEKAREQEEDKEIARKAQKSALGTFAYVFTHNLPGWNYLLGPSEIDYSNAKHKKAYVAARAAALVEDIGLSEVLGAVAGAVAGSEEAVSFASKVAKGASKVAGRLEKAGKIGKTVVKSGKIATKVTKVALTSKAGNAAIIGATTVGEAYKDIKEHKNIVDTAFDVAEVAGSQVAFGKGVESGFKDTFGHKYLTMKKMNEWEVDVARARTPLKTREIGDIKELSGRETVKGIARNKKTGEVIALRGETDAKVLTDSTGNPVHIITSKGTGNAVKIEATAFKATTRPKEIPENKMLDFKVKSKKTNPFSKILKKKKETIGVELKEGIIGTPDGSDSTILDVKEEHGSVISRKTLKTTSSSKIKNYIESNYLPNTPQVSVLHQEGPSGVEVTRLKTPEGERIIERKFINPPDDFLDELSMKQMKKPAKRPGLSIKKEPKVTELTEDETLEKPPKLRENPEKPLKLEEENIELKLEKDSRTSKKPSAPSSKSDKPSSGAKLELKEAPSLKFVENEGDDAIKVVDDALKELVYRDEVPKILEEVKNIGESGVGFISGSKFIPLSSKQETNTKTKPKTKSSLKVKGGYEEYYGPIIYHQPFPSLPDDSLLFDDTAYVSTNKKQSSLNVRKSFDGSAIPHFSNGPEQNLKVIAEVENRRHGESISLSSTPTKQKQRQVSMRTKGQAFVHVNPSLQLLVSDDSDDDTTLTSLVPSIPVALQTTTQKTAQKTKRRDHFTSSSTPTFTPTIKSQEENLENYPSILPLPTIESQEEKHKSYPAHSPISSLSNQTPPITPAPTLLVTNQEETHRYYPGILPPLQIESQEERHKRYPGPSPPPSPSTQTQTLKKIKKKTPNNRSAHPSTPVPFGVPPLEYTPPTIAPPSPFIPPSGVPGEDVPVSTSTAGWIAPLEWGDLSLGFSGLLDWLEGSDDSSTASAKKGKNDKKSKKKSKRGNKHKKKTRKKSKKRKGGK